MKSKSLYFLLLSSFCFTLSIARNSDNRKLDCLNTYLDTVKTKEVYQEIRTAVTDTLKAWIMRGLDMKWYTLNENILDDAIFFDQDYSRCLLLLIQRPPIDSLNHFNLVQVLGAEKINGRWVVYHRSFPTLSYNTGFRNGKNFDIDYLSRDARLDIINQGFIKGRPCKVNRSLIDSKYWFPEWIREKHKQFLAGH